jgi:hypothetical protein
MSRTAPTRNGGGKDHHFGVPNERFDERWCRLGRQMLSNLEAGDQVKFATEVEGLRQRVAYEPLLGNLKQLSINGHGALRDRYRAFSVIAVALRPNLHVSGITTALEAKATGRPLVITDTPGMADY